jgi:hypothetical protein
VTARRDRETRAHDARKSRRASDAGTKSELVGESAVARDFFAGRYSKVAAATFDLPSARLDERDVAFAVGALTFLGRIEDAQMCFDAWRLGATVQDPRTLAASRFFLGVAHARAGNFDRAYELLVQGVRRRLRSGDAWSAAFAFQGLACQRYFTGRYRAAARHAQRALRAAYVESFPYAKMLATDLRGHALVQVGQLRAGLELLEQAKSHAEHLGFELNAYAIECSIATYAAKFMIGDEVVDHIESLLGRRSHDSYSRHALLTELSIQLSLRGRRTDACRALEQAEHHTLKIDARRAKVTSLLARLHVTRWSEGAAACAELLEQTRELVDESDVAFRAELLGFELFVARASSDEPRGARVEQSLRTLARSHDLHWARAALEQSGAGHVRPRAFFEDQLTPLLRAVATHDQRMMHRLLSSRLLGAVPELLELVPSRRIIVLSAENALLLEDHGDVHVRNEPPRWCPALLRLLSAGDVSKELIVTTLWGLRRYNPERHDALLRTTIHRLRTFLEPYGQWVRVTPNGYGTSVPVLFVGIDEAEPQETEVPLVEGEAPSIDVPMRAAVSVVSAAVAAHDLVRAKLAQLDRASVRDVAKALGVSRSTALRLLSDLVAKKTIVRTGFARATRYSLPRPD